MKYLNEIEYYVISVILYFLKSYDLTFSLRIMFIKELGQIKPLSANQSNN